MRYLTLILGLVLAAMAAMTQTAQIGADKNARGAKKLQIDGVHYRAAKFETAQFTEFENNILNEGGLAYVYLTNISDKPVQIRFFRMNGEDESYWRLNHLIAWDRLYKRELAPGESSVWEINCPFKTFAPGENFKFSMVDQSERPVGQVELKLEEDPVKISFIRVLPDMKTLEIHLRNTGKDLVQLGDLTLAGLNIASQEWVGRSLDGLDHAIARVTLAEPVPSASLLIVKAPVSGNKGNRVVFGHRRAFADAFPIGAWHGEEDTYEIQRRMHMDTCVKGGKKSDRFFAEVAPKYGYYAMPHTGISPNVDLIRELGDSPWVRCLMIQDEPDWSIASNIMLHADTVIREYNTTKPTCITLCRDIKFFEYAAIPDIACQDHYSVTAPSSSKWKKMYGTRLEETGIYTRDLKLAAEPKPIWVWSQGIAGWGERPKRSVPTPDELAAQLVLNLGQGAKGILWFNYGLDVAAKFPDAAEAMKLWGRVMDTLREDFLAADPSDLQAESPDKVDVAPLVARDKVLLCLNNSDYDIHPEAYPFREKKEVKVSVHLPEWIQPAAAVRVTPEGILPVDLKVSGNSATITLASLKACDIVVLVKDAAAVDALKAGFDAAVALETKSF